VLNHARIGVKQVGVFILGLASVNRARDWCLRWVGSYDMAEVYPQVLACD